MSALEFTRTQKYIIGGAVGLAVLTAAIMSLARSGDSVRVAGARPVIATHAEDDAGAQVTVHVVGAVNRPGVYQLRAGARAYEAVAMAGGLARNADSQQVNLAAALQDGQQVYIPPVGGYYQQPAAQTGGTTLQPNSPDQVVYEPVVPAAPPAPPASQQSAYTTPAPARVPAPQPSPSRPDSRVQAPASAPAPSGQAAPAQAAGPSAQTAAGSAAAPSRKPDSRPPKLPVRFPINVNAATEDQLDALPGVGATLAARIVAHRDRNGPFRRPEDLSRVEGIGDKTVTRLTPYVTF